MKYRSLTNMVIVVNVIPEKSLCNNNHQLSNSYRVLTKSAKHSTCRSISGSQRILYNGGYNQTQNCNNAILI